MADTTEILLSDSAWVEVAAAATAGFLTNEGINKVKYRESATMPVDNVGHTLEMDVGAYVSFVLKAGQKVYAKSVTGASQVAVTLV